MADAQDGLALLLECCPGVHVPLEVWTPHYPDEPPSRLWARNDGHHIANLARYHDERWSAELLCGLPRPQRTWATGLQLPLLWARTESKDQAARLKRFTPAPSLVLREGATVRYMAFWLLRKPLVFEQLERANKRIAHHLRTAKKWSDPDYFEFPLPGTCLRRGRTRPVPVTCEQLSLQTHIASRVVGHLKDAPDPMAWRDR